MSKLFYIVNERTGLHCMRAHESYRLIASFRRAVMLRKVKQVIVRKEFISFGFILKHLIVCVQLI